MWVNRIELWFAMVEAKFNLHYPAITREDTKFNYILTVLSPEIAEEVSAIITTPDPIQPYTKVKQAIVARTSLSDSQKLRQLLSGEVLGHRKPSQLLRHMRQLVKNSGYVNDTTLKELFIQRMPQNAQVVLVSLDSLNLKQLAEVADRIMGTSSILNIQAIDEINPTIKASTSSSPTASMTTLIDKMDRILYHLNNNVN